MHGKLGHSTEAEISTRWTIRNEHTQRSEFWTRVKLEKVVISTVLKSKFLGGDSGQSKFWWEGCGFRDREKNSRKAVSFSTILLENWSKNSRKVINMRAESF